MFPNSKADVISCHGRDLGSRSATIRVWAGVIPSRLPVRPRIWGDLNEVTDRQRSGRQTREVPLDANSGSQKPQLTARQGLVQLSTRPWVLE